MLGLDICPIYLVNSVTQRRQYKISMDTSVVIPQLDADHEEADSRMFLVLCCAKSLGITRIVLWSIDTDMTMLSEVWLGYCNRGAICDNRNLYQKEIYSNAHWATLLPVILYRIFR